MTLPDQLVIPLDDAWYCESCRAILNHRVCCLCASEEHTQRLAPWLNRPEALVTIESHGVVISITPAKADAQKPTGTPPGAL